MILCRPRWRTFISDSWIHNLFNSRYNYNTTYGHKLICKQQQNSYEHRDHIMAWRCAYCTWFDRSFEPSTIHTGHAYFTIYYSPLFAVCFAIFILFIFSSHCTVAIRISVHIAYSRSGNVETKLLFLFYLNILDVMSVIELIVLCRIFHAISNARRNHLDINHL